MYKFNLNYKPTGKQSGGFVNAHCQAGLNTLCEMCGYTKLVKGTEPLISGGLLVEVLQYFKIQKQGIEKLPGQSVLSPLRRETANVE